MAAMMLGLGMTSLKADNFYVGGFAGANWIQDYTKNYDFSYKVGYTYGGAFGYRWACSGWRVEGEFTYRKNTIKHMSIRHLNLEFSNHGHQSYWSGMGNIIYDFCLPQTWITPFIGVGAGWYEQKINVSDNRQFHACDRGNDIAWQFLTGIAYEVNTCYSVLISYCLFKPQSRFYSHSARAGVNYNF